MKNFARTRHKSSYVVTLLCVYALALLCSPVGVRAALPKTAKLLPPDTVLLVNIEDFSQLKGQFEKTDLFKLYKDPSMAAFIDNFKTNLEQKIKDSDSELAEIITDAATLPQGKAALALVLNEKVIDADEPPVLLITEWGSKVAQVKDVVEKVVAKSVEEREARRQTEDYRGVGITSMSGKDSGAISYCFIDDAMILSANTESLKFVIAQAKGAGSQTLADSDDFNSTLRAVSSSGPGQIDVYVNIKQIIQTVTTKDEAGKLKTILTNLGLDNVTSFALSIDVGSGPGGSTSGKALLKVDGAKKGLLKLLEVETGPIQVPGFVSQSANSVSVVNLNMKKAFDEMAKILTAFSPQMAMMINMPLSPPGPQGEPPLQLKTGIFDHLGSQIVIAQSMDGSAASAAGQGMPQPDSLVALATTNRAALEKTLLLLHSTMIAPGKADARRELLGHTIYRIDLGGMMPGMGGAPGARAPMMQAPAQAGAPEMPKLAFTVTDSHLIFASEDAVERAVRTLSGGGNESVASAKWFAQAKATIPSTVGMAGLQNGEASGEFLWSMLRNMKTPPKGAGMTPTGMAGIASPQVLLSQVGADFSTPSANTSACPPRTESPDRTASSSSSST
ncbi:MAG: DUF3352 domain-containing protein [Planctomycetota bacterium]|jgi:hypothetical protein